MERDVQQQTPQTPQTHQYSPDIYEPFENYEIPDFSNTNVSPTKPQQPQQPQQSIHTDYTIKTANVGQKSQPIAPPKINFHSFSRGPNKYQQPQNTAYTYNVPPAQSTSPYGRIVEEDNLINDTIIENKRSGPSVRDVPDSTAKATTVPVSVETVDSDDKEANWVLFSRESSMLDTEFKSARDINNMNQKSTPLHMKSLAHSDAYANNNRFSSRRDTSAADSFKDTITTINSQVKSPPNPFSATFMKRDASLQSLTPSQYAEQFSQEIDLNFSSLDSQVYDRAMRQQESSGKSRTTDSIFQNSNRQQESYQLMNPIQFGGGRDKADDNEVAKRYSGMGTSSEDELVSHDELYYTPKKSFDESPQMTHGSFSSENTIINELLQDNKGGAGTLAPGRTNMHREDTNRTLTEENPGGDFYINQFDSMAYLSDILSGKIDINAV